jgi:AraC-like DNA-binding protein
MSLFQCGRELQPSEGGNNPIIRNHLLIFYVISGKGTFYQGKKAYQVEPGQVFVILPGYITDYKYDKDDPWEYYFLTFAGDDEDININISTLGLDADNCVFTLTPPVSIISQWLSQVVESFLTYDENEFRIIGYIYLFLAEIADASPLTKYKESLTKYKEYRNHYLDTIIRYIHVNYAQNLTVTELSKKFNISRTHLCRVFKDYTGFSPKQYIINTCIEAAKTYLSSSRFSIKYIAQECGFRDSMHLSVVFKTQTSLSPTQYRAQHHQKID